MQLTVSVITYQQVAITVYASPFIFHWIMWLTWNETELINTRENNYNNFAELIIFLDYSYGRRMENKLPYKLFSTMQFIHNPVVYVIFLS